MISLTRAGLADIPFMMATERRAGNEGVLGRWEREQHAAALADPEFAYFIGRKDGEAVGFAMLQGWGGHATLLRRFAVATPGLGHGTAMLQMLAELVFGQTPCHRLHLGVFPENIRAQRAYKAAGFKPEGIARGSTVYNGVPRDELIMARLRGDAAP